MRVCLFLLLGFFVVHANAFNDEKALEHYLQATKAFANNQLAEAELSAEKALAIRSHDGIVKSNTREIFKRSFIGRRSQRTVTKYGDPNDYFPNRLLTKIQEVKYEQLAFASKLHKQKNPPILRIHSIEISDEDNNGVLTALEQGTISFIVENTGGSLAEKVNININTFHDSIDDLTGKITLGDIAQGQQKSFYRQYTLPKHIGDNFDQIEIRVTEFDGLGETSSLVDIATRPYFAPLLTAKLLSDRSSLITSKRPATLYYEISNAGAEVARDIELKLDFDLANAVRIVKNIDLTKVNQLNVGEKRELSFTVQALNTSYTSNELGMSLVTKYRGKSEQKIPLLLSAELSKDNYRSAVNQYLAQLNNFDKTQAAMVKPNEMAVLIDIQAGLKSMQAKNVQLMTGVFSQHVGIPANNLIRKTWIDSKAWHKFFGTELPQKLANKAIERPFNTLHVYVTGVGKFDHLSDQATLSLPATSTKQSSVVLAKWINKLSMLPVNNINVYLEVPFKSDERQNLYVSLYQPLLSEIPENINLYTAALPKQSTHALSRTNTGIFSYALAHGFTQLADRNKHPAVFAHQLQAFITNEVNKYSTSFGVQKQHPWSIVNQNHQSTQAIK